MTLRRHPRRDSNSEAQKPPPPKRPLYTPKAKQARIIAASLAGKSQRQIAREVGADRETVSRVLSQSEVQAFLDAYRDQYRELVPLALDLLRHELSIVPRRGKHANPDALKVAIEITKGAQVAVPRSQGELEVRRDRFSEMTDEELDYFIKTGKELKNPKAPPLFARRSLHIRFPALV